MVSQAPQRDSHGRFQPGCKPGPGRPRKDREAAWQAAFSEALPPDELQAVVVAMVDKAKGGNVSAARLLIEHASGRPAIRIAFEDAPEEYRVAGATPDALIDEQIQRLAARLREVKEREAMIRCGEQPEPEPMPAAPSERDAPTVPAFDFDSRELESRIRFKLDSGLASAEVAATLGVAPAVVDRVAEAMAAQDQDR